MPGLEINRGLVQKFPQKLQLYQLKLHILKLNKLLIVALYLDMLVA